MTVILLIVAALLLLAWLARFTYVERKNYLKHEADRVRFEDLFYH